MPRKKQIVQTKRRQKAYSGGEMSGEATRLKPRGIFKMFSNYTVFAAIGAVALIGGILIVALYQPSSGRNQEGTVRGEGVRRTTPQAGATSTTGAAANIKQYAQPPAMVIDPAKSYTATIKTATGDVTIELFDDDAPQTVNNFVFLAREGFYDGVTFHRVIEDFVAQAGDPTGTGSGGPGYELPVEATTEPFEPGIIAMAQPPAAGALNNGSQFFITLDAEPTFAGKFTAFGRVTDGLDVVQGFEPRDPLAVKDPPPGARIETITITES